VKPFLSRRILFPGEPGSKKWLNQYRENLVCVRYRYDLKTQQRLTTAEIIVDRQRWTCHPTRTPPNKFMNLRIEYGESELAQQVKSLGGSWDRQKKVWKLPLRYVQILKLEDRIVQNKNGG
jgi:hypothetical protein